jgi:hypothetical protein
MNTKTVRTLLTNLSRFRWLTAALLVGLLAIALTACGGAGAVPTAVSTIAPATATPAVVPPTSTVAPATSTEAVALAAVIAPPSTDVTHVDESSNTTIDPEALDSALTGTAAGVLSDSEVEGILYMREEEKLARDVYLTLYEKWEMPIFQNISDSEATHMEAVKSLIDRYDLADPAEGKGVGVFVDETLQGLYDQLVAEGSQSLSGALRVGAAIEEIDIIDLQEHIGQTDKADILVVYENLTKGSRNHLRSIVSTLSKQTGETYQPQYLDPATYDAIVGSETERGRGN